MNKPAFHFRTGNASAIPRILLSIVKGIHDFRKCGEHRGVSVLAGFAGYDPFRGVRFM